MEGAWSSARNQLQEGGRGGGGGGGGGGSETPAGIGASTPALFLGSTLCCCGVS